VILIECNQPVKYCEPLKALSKANIILSKPSLSQYKPYSLEVTSRKVLKKLAYYTLLGGHSKKVVSRSEFCADFESTNSGILSLPKLKLLLKKQIDILDG